jgi:hypothetical protein
LPTDPNDLEALLSDPVQRAALRIATERPVAWVGLGLQESPTSVRLSSNSSTNSGAMPRDLIGRSIEVLRGDLRPAQASSSWSANPLSMPTAVLPWRDGDTALVLDSPVSGAWRLREIELSTGDVVRSIAASSGGDPCALASVAGNPTSVLVADVVVDAWEVLRVDIESGTISTLKSGDGSTALGVIRGLVSTSEQAALITVADSLIAIDANTMPATERVVVSGFQEARGLAIDPVRADRVFLAERDWINPSSSVLEGRVVSVDLRSLSVTGLVATGVPLMRPVSLAIERDGAQLLALCDASAADTTMELRAVVLGGGDGGAAHEIVDDVPLGASQVATGPDALRIVVIPATNELAIGGGLEQARAIVAEDTAGQLVTLQSALAPASSLPFQCRITDDTLVTSATPAGESDVFVWDSSDLVEGGQAFLRGVPYDTGQGLPSDTSVPRTVLAGLDVLGLAVGSATSTSDVEGVAVADLDGDGDLDLATANPGTDRVTVFLQSAPATYPVSPDVTLAGIPILAPMTDPVAVVAGDIDSDGDLDLVSANRGSRAATTSR